MAHSTDDNVIVYAKVSTTTCRCCLITDQNQTVPMFDVYVDSEHFPKILEECTAVKINEKDTFSNICGLCIDKTKQFYDFRKKCQQLDAVLKTIVLQQEADSLNEIFADETECQEEIEIRVETVPEIKDEGCKTRIKSEETKIDCDIATATINKEIVKSSKIEIEVKPDIYIEKCQPTEKDATKVANSEPKEKEKQASEFICGQCDDIFDTWQDLQKHRKLMSHLKRRKKRCKLCGKIAVDLIQHMKTHSKERPYACRYCGKSFTVKENMARHERIHTGERPYTCEICGQGFIQKISLTDHMGKHNKDSWYVCSYCGKSTRIYATHKAHVLTHTKGEELAKETQCDVCNKVLSCKSALLTHKQMHGENYLCSECGKSCNTEAALKSHLDVHRRDELFSCPICGKSFKRQRALKLHNNVHTGIKPYTCKICNKGFKQPCHLSLHMSLHTGERRYACSFCNKAFRLKGNLTVHQRIHTGETPHVCDVCNKGFYNTSGLKKHKKTHKSAVTKNK